MMNEPLSTIMTKKVISAGPDDKLSVARDIFKQNRVHHLPIVHGTKLIGILTTYDMFKLVDMGTDYDKVIIKSVMTQHVATLAPEDKIGSAAELFLENLFHAVPIVKDGELEGIVTSFDVIKYSFHKAYPTQSLK